MKFICDENILLLYFVLASLVAAVSVSFRVFFLWETTELFFSRQSRSHCQIVTLVAGTT